MVVAVCAASACFAPDVQRCALQCNNEGACPPGLTCLTDNFCHEAATEALCSASSDASVADAAPGAPDADPNAPDADPSQPDAATPPIPTVPGQLVITEIMKDPCVVVAANCTVIDSDGEWFEVHNPTPDAFDLEGLLFRDDVGQQFIVTSPLVIAAGGHLVFGVNDDPIENGGAPVDFVYPNSFILNNNQPDAIEIIYIGSEPDTIIDRAAWNDAQFPDDPGEALSLSPASYDATANDLGANWCSAPNSFGDGDHGSPGAENPACPQRIRPARSSAAPHARHVRRATRRDLVTNLEALGEPEPLELADVGFERSGVASQLRREPGRRDSRILRDDAERVPGPRVVGVHALELGAYQLDIAVVELIVERHVDPVTIAAMVKLHPVELGIRFDCAAGAGAQVGDQLVARRKSRDLRLALGDVSDPDDVDAVDLENPDRMTAVAAARLDLRLFPAAKREPNLARHEPVVELLLEQ